MEDVKGAVTIQIIQVKRDTNHHIDDPSTLPKGDVPGTVNVPVTVTYQTVQRSSESKKSQQVKNQLQIM